MKVKNNRSILGILSSTNNYLIIAIFLFISTVLVAGAVILFQSHKSACELFNSKMETSSSNIAREIALGERIVSEHLFEKVVSSIKNVSSEVNLVLKQGTLEVKSYDCRPGILYSDISHELLFSGDRVGLITGEIKSFGFNTIISFVLFTILLLFSVLKFIKNKLIENIRDQIVSPIESLCLQRPINYESLPTEVQNIALILNKFKTTIVISEKARMELSHAEELSNVATQVAHDVRSPLETLKSLKSELALLPSDARKRVQLSINRIEEITFNLLKNHKQLTHAENLHHSEGLLGLLNDVVTEKNIEFRNLKSVEIIESFNSTSYGIYSKIQRNNLKNIISNLINNGVESLYGLHGIILVSLRNEDNRNIISVSDNGVGVSAEVRQKIFAKGFTTKRNGNGLGLFNAKLDIEAMGGSLTFSSELGKGTTFTITLPMSDSPPTFIDAIHAHKYERIIILDDDPAFHEIWSKRLEVIESEVEHIYSVQEMLSKYQGLHPKILLLSDFELMDNELDGIDTILKLNHSQHSVLVTARSEELAIQERCLKNGIKLLPKSLVNYIKVIASNNEDSEDSSGPVSTFIEGGQARDSDDLIDSSQSPVILIDDDKLIRINWSMYCKKNNIPFREFSSIDTFLSESESISKETRIYIDLNLGNGIEGEIESEKIFQLGFLNLYFATGYEKDSIKKPIWIKEIFSKSPENIRN